MFPGFSNPVVPIETESSSENEFDDTGSCPEVNRGGGIGLTLASGSRMNFLDETGGDLASLWNGVIDDWGVVDMVTQAAAFVLVVDVKPLQGLSIKVLRRLKPVAPVPHGIL